MKVCLLLQNQYAKLGHALALNLREQFGVQEFSAYVISPGAESFVQNQSEIRYSPMLVDHRLHTLYASTPLDLDYIKSFEQRYGPPNIWQYLYADRKLMMSMGPKEETTTVIDPLYPHEDLMKIFQVRAQAIEKMLIESKPDVVVFFAIGALGHLILYHVAHKLGIKTINIDFPRIGNRISLTEDFRTLTGVDALFKNGSNTLTDPYREQARNFISTFRTTGSLQLEYFEAAINDAARQARLPFWKKGLRTIRYLYTLTGNYLKNRRYFTYGMTDIHPGRFVLYKLRERFRAWRGLHDLYSTPNPNEDYAFFPLHFEPELALLLLSPFHFDQIELIRSIARSLPLHFKLYVKEHPAMRNKRPRTYYKKLLKIPNVKLIDPSVRSFEITRHAKLITTITGTVGWEASLLGKPVITFGEVFYNSLPFVRRVQNIELLPSVINEQLCSFHYSEDTIEKFVAAALADSRPLPFFELWYENDITTLKNHPSVQEVARLIFSKMN